MGQGCRAGWSSVVSKRRVGAELGGGVGTGVLRALDLPEGSVRVLQRWSRGQISPMVTGGDELGRRRDSPAWRSRRRSAPSRGKAAARVVRRAGGWREQGGSRLGLKGAPEISGGRAPEGKAGEKSGRIPLRGCCASGGRGEDGPDPWGRLVSEATRSERRQAERGVSECGVASAWAVE